MEFQLDRVVRQLERITKTLIKMENQLEDLNKNLKNLSTLASCVETYANGKAYFHIADN